MKKTRLIKEINANEIRQHIVSAKKLSELKKWQVIYLSSFYELSNQFISRVTGHPVKTVNKIMLDYHSFLEESYRSQVSGKMDSLLNARELRLIRLLCMGKLNREIAEESGVSKRTIESQRKSLYNKLEVSNLAELIVLAIKHKILAI